MGKKILIILMSSIEALSLASIVAMIAFSTFIYTCDFRNPIFHYHGQTSFDHTIVDSDGNEYPAGTVFEVPYLFRGGYMRIEYNSNYIFDENNSSYHISEAANSDELYEALDQFLKEDDQDLAASAVLPAIITIAVFTGLLALFIFINKKMKIVGRIIVLVVVCTIGISFTRSLSYYLSRAHAPIIYLYPEEETEVNVKLTLDGNLTSSYPRYNDALGWTVTALPDGTLTDGNGREYEYLFWEGDLAIKPDLTHGFCVKGEDTAEFLEDSLAKLGLTDKEADTFIMYWLPQLESNKYNVITFQTEAYENAASLEITPAPDTVIRVNMLWYPVNSYVDMEPQDLESLNPSTREGFTVVEWGGEKYERGVLGLLVR